MNHKHCLNFYLTQKTTGFHHATFYKDGVKISKWCDIRKTLWSVRMWVVRWADVKCM